LPIHGVLPSPPNRNHSELTTWDSHHFFSLRVWRCTPPNSGAFYGVADTAVANPLCVFSSHLFEHWFFNDAPPYSAVYRLALVVTYNVFFFFFAPPIEKISRADHHSCFIRPIFSTPILLSRGNPILVLWFISAHSRTDSPLINASMMHKML